jgi:hypothetical protein
MSELLEVYKRFLRQRHKNYGRRKSPTRVYTEAELIWSGENYILVREGPFEGCRRTVLVDKGGLMLLRGNGGSPLETLAAATLHPAQIEQVEMGVIVLHVSGKKDEFKRPFEGRWTKSLVKKLIKSAEEADLAYEGEFEKIKAEFEERNRRSQKAVALVKRLPLLVGGTSSRNGVEWPAGEQFEVYNNSNCYYRLCHFYVGRLDGQLNVQLGATLSNLSLDQFERLLILLKEIQETESEVKHELEEVN